MRGTRQAGLRQVVEYAAYLAARGAATLLPPSLARRLGRAAGSMAGRLDRRHAAIARENLGLAFPEWSIEQIEATAQRCFEHFGVILFEYLKLAEWNGERIAARVRIEGAQHYLAARDKGRGVFLMSAHLGNWELGALTAGFVHGALHLVARRLDNPRLEAALAGARCRFGNVLIDKRDGARDILRALRNKETIAILIDQSVQEHEGARVPFFGRPATTSTALARIAAKHRAPVVPVYCWPQDDGSYVLRFYAEIAPPAEPDPQGVAYTAALTAHVEGAIRERPELWLWLHRRWKQRPGPSPPISPPMPPGKTDGG